MGLSTSTWLGLAAIAAAGVVAFRLVGKAGEFVQSGALDPTSADNLAYLGVNGIGRSITGDSTWDLGYALHAATHTDPTDPTRNTALAAINPADPGNVVNRTLEDLTRSVTGDPAWTLGGWLYDVTH